MPSVSVKVEGLKEAMAMFDPKKVERAASSAIKKVAQQARTEASSSIRDKFNIKKADVDKKIEVKQYNRSELSATLLITGRGISLTYFGAKERRGAKVISRKGIKVLKRQPKGAQGVQVKILKGGKVTTLPHAFIATMKTGHIGVFIEDKTKRMKDKKKWAIKEMALVSIPTLFQQKTVMERVETRINEQWPKVFQQEMNYQLTRK